jgi:hypothetical protein
MSYGIRKTVYTDGCQELHFLQSDYLHFKVEFDYLPWPDGDGQLWIGLSNDEGTQAGAGEYLTLEDAKVLRDWLNEVLG